MNNPTRPYFTAALYFEIITAGIANEKPVCAQQFAKICFSLIFPSCFLHNPSILQGLALLQHAPLKVHHLSLGRIDAEVRIHTKAVEAECK